MGTPAKGRQDDDDLALTLIEHLDADIALHALKASYGFRRKGRQAERQGAEREAAGGETLFDHCICSLLFSDVTQQA